MNKLSPTLERKLLAAVDQVTTHVNSGYSPTDALYKVASDYQLMPPFIRLVGSSYNTGETAMKRETGNSVLEKLASFPLADPEAVISRIYPEDVKAPNQKKADEAISSEYDRAPAYTRKEHAEKEARARASVLPKLPTPEGHVGGLTPNYGDILGRTYDSIHNIRSEIETSKMAVYRADREWRTALGHLTGYFKQASMDRESFGLVASNAYQAEPTTFMSKILDYVHHYGCPKDSWDGYKSASAFSELDWDKRPYDLLKKAYDAGGAYAGALYDHSQLFGEGVFKTANLLATTPQAAPEPSRSPLLAAQEKKASWAYEGDSNSLEALWARKAAFETFPLHLQSSFLAAGDTRMVGHMLSTATNSIGANTISSCGFKHTSPQKEAMLIGPIPRSADDWGPYKALKLPKKAEYPEHVKNLWDPDYKHEEDKAGTVEIPDANDCLEKGAVYEKSPLLGEKAAIGLVGMTLANTMAHKLQDNTEAVEKARQARIQEFQDKLSDPTQAARLRQIRAQANLNALVAGDPVFQNHLPEEVSQAYNEIIQMSPRVAEQPMLLAPLMRKRLEQQVVEPFESTEALKAEKGILSTQENPKINMEE